MSAVVQAVTVDGAPPLCLSHIRGGTSSRCPPSSKRSPWTVPLHCVCRISVEGHRLDVRRRARGHRGRCPSIVFVAYPWRDIVSMSAVVQAVTGDGDPPSCLSHIRGGTSSRCPPSFKRSPRTVPLHRVCHISVEGHRLDVRRRSSGHRGRCPSIVFVAYPWRDIVSMSAVVQAVTVGGAPPLYLSHIRGGTSSRCPPSFKRSPRTVPLHRVCRISLKGHRLDVRRRA